MPFGSERHVHRFNALINITKNREGIWIKTFECQFCPKKTYVKLEYLPIDEQTLDPKTGLHKVGIFKDEEKTYIVS